MVPYFIGKTILCDLDDVIGAFGEYISSRLSARTGIKKTIEDYLTYEFNKYHEASYEDFLDEVVCSEAFKRIQPTDGALEGLRILKELGYTIRIVTARGAFVNSYQETLSWLKYHTPHFDSLDVVDPSKESKSDIYKKYADEGIASLIDDATHNLVDAIESGIVYRPVCITRPWNVQDNRFVDGINRFSDLFSFAVNLRNKAANDGNIDSELKAV
ncbi:hypothetical protein [Vibrio sp. D431a]|uniref:5' nucleotidase, NT5C type n=1 Tax=Vibrio sp. D431a TaxID=2837388 RepID=UPI002552409E|nr:hypothetical protein [Vibrio sp. D431a]